MIEYDMLTEGVSAKYRNCKNNLEKYLVHLIKYRYEQKEQRENIGSWAQSICSSFNNINKELKNEGIKFGFINYEIRNRFGMDKYYKKALKKVNSERRNKSIEIPERIPIEWEDLQIILSEEWLANFFVQYAYNQDIIDYLNRKYPDIMRLRTI